MTLTPEGVVAILRSTQATAEHSLAEVLHGIPKWHETNLHDFVAELVRKEQLTLFQSKQILRGKSIRFGKYLLYDRISTDDLGQVFKARDSEADRIVSLRLLKHGQQESTKQFEPAINRAINFATNPNTNVGSTLDAGVRHGQPYVVAELTNGVSLARHIRTNGKLTVDEAFEWITQAARGLDEIHRRGITHHAVSPLSLVITKDGVVKVDGVGVSRVRANRLIDQDRPLSTEDLVFLNCLAPELYDGRKKADHRADIYALGCTLYYLVAASAPYSGRTLAEKKRAHKAGPLPSLKPVCSDATDEIDQLFQKMIATKAKDRFRTADDLVKSIEMVYGGVEHKNEKPSRQISLFVLLERVEKFFTPKWASQHVSLLVTLAFLAVFLICVLIGGLLGTRNRTLAQGTPSTNPVEVEVDGAPQVKLPNSEKESVNANSSDSSTGANFAEVPQPMSGAFEALTFVAQVRQDTKNAENRSFATICRIRPDGITQRQAILPSTDEIEQLRQQVNDGSLLEIMSLDLSNTDTRDQDLRYFSCLSSLEAIDLRGTRVTPSGIEHLPTAPLKDLSIDGSHDMGSTEFEVIEKKYGETLTTLCIEGAAQRQVPELKQIKVRLPQLLKLRLPNIRVSDESRLDLKQQLVSCEVSWD